MTRIHTALILCFAVLLGIQAVHAQDTKENADFKLALNLYNDKLYDLAIDQFRQFVAAYPNTQQGIEARFTIGSGLMMLKKYDEARTEFQNFAVNYPQNPKAPDAWWQVGEAYAALGNPSEAASAFERLKMFYPSSKLAPDALIRASALFLQASDSNDAKKVLRALLQEYSTSQSVLTARLRLGAILAKEGNFDGARTEFRRVLDGSVTDLKAEALVALGNLNASAGKVEEAEKNLREAITTYPKSPSAAAGALALGTLYRRLGNLDGAMTLLKKVTGDSSVTDTTLRQNALMEYGEAARQNHDMKSALASYDSFLSKFPASPLVPQVLLSAGEAAAANGEPARSDKYFRQTVQRFHSSPESRLALVHLERNAADQKHYREAIALARQFASAYPSDGASPRLLLDAAGIAGDSLDDAPLALELYREVVGSYTSSEWIDDAFYGIAQCTESTSTIEKAIAAYNDVLRQYPATDYADAIEHRIDSLKTYALKNHDAGLEKLAQLMSDVIAQQSRADLSSRLAEIYYYDLKDYRAAAAQYANALSQGLADSLARMHASLYRARALRLLSAVDERMSDDAMKAYDEFLQAYPSSPDVPDAVVERGLMRGGAVADPQGLLSLIASNEQKAFTAVRMARVLVKSGAYDSASRLLEPFTGVHPEALYLTARILDLEGNKDSAAVMYGRYAEKYPNGRYAAIALLRHARRLLELGNTAEVGHSCDRLRNEFFYTTQAAEVDLLAAEASRIAGDVGGAIERYVAILRSLKEDALTAEAPQPEIVIALAGLSAKAGDVLHSKQYYREYLTLIPSGPAALDALTALGNYARTEGNIELATSFFKRAGELSGGASSKKEMADLLYESGNYAEAIKELTALGQQSTDANEKKVFESRIIIARFRSGDAAGAETLLARFRKTYSKDEVSIAEMILERGIQLFRKNDYGKAKKVFDEILDDFDETPSAPPALYWNGRIDDASNRNDNAVKTLEEVVNRYPTAPIVQRAQLALGNIYFRKEQYEKAIGYYRSIVDSSTDAEILPLALNNIIIAYKQVGVYDAALQLTRKFISLYPNDESITDKRVDVGILYEKLGYYDQAIVHFQHLLDEANSDLEAEIRYYLGECYYYQAHYEQAILEFLKVPYLIAKKTKIDWTPNAFYMSGQSYEKMGKYQQSIGMYQQIIDRSGIDETFKAAAEKEIKRVKTLVQQGDSK